MEIKLGVRRTRRSSPNPAISLSNDNDTICKLNFAHLKGSSTMKLRIGIKQDGAEIAVVSGEREDITPVTEGADHVRIHEKSVMAMEEEIGGGGSHEKTGAMADNRVLPCRIEGGKIAVPHEVAPPIMQEKSEVCEQCQGSGATESTIQEAQAEKHNPHGENRREEAAQEQLNLNINIANAAPAETNNRELLRSPSFLAGSAALVSVLALAIHFIRPRRN